MFKWYIRHFFKKVRNTYLICKYSVKFTIDTLKRPKETNFTIEGQKVRKFEYLVNGYKLFYKIYKNN